MTIKFMNKPRKITFVKKIKENGEPCRKCQEVAERLLENDELKFIDRMLVADMRDPDSEGCRLAEQYGVETAPFFLVDEGGRVTVYKTYLSLKKEVFNKKPDAADIEIEEKRKPDPNDDLYFI